MRCGNETVRGIVMALNNDRTHDKLAYYTANRPITVENHSKQFGSVVPGGEDTRGSTRRGRGETREKGTSLPAH